jgi:CheY-like chemotaxis protein
MAKKRALVVDDSKSARVALQRLLERYDIESAFAESGEDAIEYLKSHEADVIFMDHSMPGMDGFEAVSAIKADPRTAMIPVMMYTAKEGEVYVGQARALGAIDVLPKQVQPGVLFDMLLKLGLVRDRRARRRRRGADGPPPAARRGQELDETDRLLDRQALGMSIQALITRVLQDQHLELRSDVLASNRDFAKRVAEEILAKQQAEAEAAPAEPPRRAGLGGAGLVLVLLIALLPAAILFSLWSQVVEQRDALLADNTRLAASFEEQSEAVEALQSEMMSGIDVERREAGSRYLALVEALQWAVNQDNQFAFDEVPFSDAQLERLRELLARLSAIGFSGVIRLEAHLGEFCLDNDEGGGYRLAEPDRPVMDCALRGHPQGGAALLRERQSVAFANFLATSPLLNGGEIEVELVAHGSRDSVRRHGFSPNIRTAGEWNRIAGLNNRVEFTLIPR